MTTTPARPAVPLTRRPVPSDLAHAATAWTAYLDQLEQALDRLAEDLTTDEAPDVPTLTEPGESMPLVLEARAAALQERLDELTDRLTTRRDDVQKELAGLPRPPAGADQRRFAAGSLGNRVDLSG